MIKSTMKAAQVLEQIGVVAAHEKISKVLVAEIAAETLAHACEHGDITLVNKLLPVLTPANRTAVVLLFKECTLFAYDVKAKQFGKKNKADADKAAAVEEQLKAFVEQYQSNLWAWYEAEKADKIESAKFSEVALKKQILAYLATKGSFDGLDEVIETAKADATKANTLKEAHQAKVDQLVAMGMTAKEAKSIADAMAKDGRLTAQ